MFIALLLLGLFLIAFGALVLLRYSDRPGGTVKWLGAEVSSNGAGLPLVALGVGCILFAVVRSAPAGPAPGDRTSGVVAPVGPAGNPPSPAGRTCMDGWIAGVSSDRVRTAEVGMRDLEVIGPHQSLDDPFVLVLTENGERIGAVRLRLYRASNAGSDLYRVEEAVDADCEPVEEMTNASRGGNPREIVNWDTLRLRLGDHRYDVRIGGEGSISVGHLARVG